MQSRKCSTKFHFINTLILVVFLTFHVTGTDIIEIILDRDEPITKNCRLADSINRQPITMYNRPINRH